MLPTGHIAAGYLVAKAVLHFSPWQFTVSQQHWLLLLGSFFAFAPDLDSFYLFFKVKGFTIHDGSPSHRDYVSHAPFVWLAVGLSLFFISSDPFYKMTGLLLWLCSWSHFALDCIQADVMWLWPFSTKRFGWGVQKPVFSKEQKFWRYWFATGIQYIKKATVAFSAEVALMIAAVWVFFR